MLSSSSFDYRESPPQAVTAVSTSEDAQDPTISTPINVIRPPLSGRYIPTSAKIQGYMCWSWSGGLTSSSQNSETFS